MRYTWKIFTISFVPNHNLKRFNQSGHFTSYTSAVSWRLNVDVVAETHEASGAKVLKGITIMLAFGATSYQNFRGFFVDDVGRDDFSGDVHQSEV